MNRIVILPAHVGRLVHGAKRSNGRTLFGDGAPPLPNCKELVRFGCRAWLTNAGRRPEDRGQSNGARTASSVADVDVPAGEEQPGQADLRDAVERYARERLPRRRWIGRDAVAGLNATLTSVPDGMARITSVASP